MLTEEVIWEGTEPPIVAKKTLPEEIEWEGEATPISEDVQWDIQLETPTMPQWGYRMPSKEEPLPEEVVPKEDLSDIQKLQGVSTLGITHPEQERAGETLRSAKALKQRLAEISTAMQAQPEFYKGQTPESVFQRQIEAEKTGTTGEVQPSAVDPIDWAAFIVGGGIPGIVKAGMTAGLRMAASKAIIRGLEATAMGLVQIPIGQATESLLDTDFGRTHPEVPIALNFIANGATIYGLNRALNNLQMTDTWRKMSITDRDLVTQTIEQMKQAQPYGQFKGFTEGQIARMSPAAYQEAFAKRMPTEVPVTPEPIVSPEIIASQFKDSLATMYETRVTQYMAQGMPSETAILKAFGEVSNTLEGQMQAKKIMEAQQVETETAKQQEEIKTTEQAVKEVEEVTPKENVIWEEPAKPIEAPITLESIKQKKVSNIPLTEQEIAFLKEQPLKESIAAKEVIEQQKKMTQEGLTIKPQTIVDDQSIRDIAEDLNKGNMDAVNKSIEDATQKGYNPNEIMHNVRTVANQLLKEKPIPVKAKPAMPKSLLKFINSKGGLDIGNLEGEFKIILENNPQMKLLKRKGGKWGVDQMAQMLNSEGLLPDAKPQTLMDALSNKTFKTPEIKEKKAIRKEQIYPDQLAEGQKVIINGEEFTRKGTKLEDGEDIEIDPFEKLTVDEVLPVKEKKVKPFQPDMLGVVEGTLEGKIPSVELPETALEKATKEAETRKVGTEMAEKQEVLPKAVDVPTGWSTAIVPNFRRPSGWQSEVDWKNNRIVFETAENAQNINIINHEIAHIHIEDKLVYIKKLSDSPFLTQYAKIVEEPKDTHINFIREHLAMDYGEYLTNPRKVNPELKNLFETEMKAKQVEIPEGKQPWEKTLYRGVSKKTPVDEGMYGKGEYWTNDKKYASQYAEEIEGGKVLEKKIKLNNPYFSNYTDLQKIYNESMENSIDKGISIIEAKESAAKFVTETIASKGHDGIVIQGEIPSPEKIVERLKYGYPLQYEEVIIFKPEVLKDYPDLVKEAKVGEQAGMAEIIKQIWYRGTKTDASGLPRSGIPYLTDDKAIAGTYGGKIQSFKIKEGSNIATDIPPNLKTKKEIREWAEEQGFDAVIYNKGTKRGENELAIFNKNIIEPTKAGVEVKPTVPVDIQAIISKVDAGKQLTGDEALKYADYKESLKIKTVTPEIKEGITEPIIEPKPTELKPVKSIESIIKEGKPVTVADLKNTYEFKQKSASLKQITDILKDKGIEVTGKVPLTALENKTIDRLYKEGQAREKQIGQVGFVRVSPIKSNFVTDIINKTKEKIKAIIEPFTFYKNAPKPLQNDIRTDLIGGTHRLYEQREKHRVALFGGMDDTQISKAVEIIYARDEVARQKASKGNPDITLADAQKNLDDLVKKVSPEELASADRWKEISKEYQDKLIERGELDPEDTFEDYARHYVIDYTPEWAPTVGIPSKLRRPFRGYTKRAFGTTKEYRKDADSLVDYLTEVDYNNLVEDFITNQATKYDITPTLDKVTKKVIFGVDKAGRIRPYAKSSRIYEIEGKRYRAYSPDKPFTRQFYPTETGEMAIGREKKTYLVPENVYNTFESFSPRGSKGWYLINKATSYFKTSAILSVFPRYNINNLIGDSWMIGLQHPEPIKLTSKISDSLNFLIKKSDKLTSKDKEFLKFITDNDILGATFINELPHIRMAKDPLKYLIQKSVAISQFRESILRTANAKYLFDEMQKGNGDNIRKSFNWINTEGLSTDKALGKIAREILVDYEATSKTYNRAIRGFLFPFGRWYFKGSELMWKFAKEHPFKALGGLLALPALGLVLNNRSDEVKEMESKLPEGLRDGFHIILGKTDDGRIRVWNMQTPQDALIGTKIFSIASNQINMYLNGQKSLQDATIDTIKHWGIKEAKGIAYLTTPVARFLKGMIDRKDPVDNQPLYPFMDVSKMTLSKKIWRDNLFLFKCMTPILSGYISESEGKIKPPEQAAKEVLNKFIGLPSLGIRDYNEKMEIIMPDGRKLSYDEFNRLQNIEQKEAGILLDIKEGFIKSGKLPTEYYNSPDFIKNTKQLMELHKGTLQKETIDSLKDRIINQIEDPTVLKFWYENRIAQVNTPEEKAKLREEQKQVKTFQMLEKLKKMPVSVRRHIMENTEE